MKIAVVKSGCHNFRLFPVVASSDDFIIEKSVDDFITARYALALPVVSIRLSGHLRNRPLELS